MTDPHERLSYNPDFCTCGEAWEGHPMTDPLRAALTPDGRPMPWDEDIKAAWAEFGRAIDEGNVASIVWHRKHVAGLMFDLGYRAALATDTAPPHIPGCDLPETHRDCAFRPVIPGFVAADTAPLDVGRAFVRPEVAEAFDREECRFPGCGLPRRLHGAPPGVEPNPTRSTHHFRAALAAADTAPLEARLRSIPGLQFSFLDDDGQPYEPANQRDDEDLYEYVARLAETP